MTDIAPTVTVGTRPVVTLRDALQEEVVMAAVEEVVRRRRADVRTYVASLPGVADALDDGSGYSEAADGAGEVLVTSPKLKPDVVDQAAFEAWVLTEMPDRTTTREVVDWSRVESAMASDPDLRDMLLHLLDDVPGAVRVETYTDEKLPRDLLSAKRSKVTDDGRLFLKETGEEVPGLRAVPASSPSLRVRPDSDAVVAMADRVYATMALPGGDT